MQGGSNKELINQPKVDFGYLQVELASDCIKTPKYIYKHIADIITKKFVFSFLLDFISSFFYPCSGPLSLPHQ